MLVIGNGESRKDIDLNYYGLPTIGCNAICRDYIVDHLVAIDRKCIDEALHYKCANIHTTSVLAARYTKSNVNVLPSTISLLNPGSGPYAIILGAELSPVVHIIGFDIWSNNGLVNNIYKDTPNYRAAARCAVDPNYWIIDITNIFKYYCNTQFFVYNKHNWQMPIEWNQHNVQQKELYELQMDY
jgi:hypothetical protein